MPINKVGELTIQGHKDPFANTVKEEMNLTVQGTKRGDFIYINPLVIPQITKNNFTQSERKLPVEFSYPYTFQITTTIMIPDGYAVEELPQSQKVKLEGEAGSMAYNIQQQDKTIQCKYRFQLNEVVFPAMNYPMLRDFFGIVSSKNAEMVILKKI